ncbi:MAG: uncharacterized protein K0R24_2036 [Gammaproteobacteria bacterium]|jgi:abortive infection bacteriophage resistance protein|nr:uncharacterized protein [Gammaproteobacteria bacterium]
MIDFEAVLGTISLTIPVTPINNANPNGLFISMNNKIIFDKPALSIEEQINLLLNRNLILNDLHEACHYLTTIVYYRLMIYFKPFLASTINSDNEFKPETSFSDIVSLYVFDRKLRLLVTDASERIEVAFRTAILPKIIGEKNFLIYFLLFLTFHLQKWDL